jgi:cation diffusion facilitator CzcD-associated flavoprotein CzcO
VTGVDPRTLKAGQRVRITPRTFDGTVVEVFDGRFTINDTLIHPAFDTMSVAFDHGTVEIIPDPLPTVPGTRFWGATLSTESQWWFVQAYGSGGLISYAAADGRSISGDGVQSSYLRVLPEPTAEVSP